MNQTDIDVSQQEEKPKSKEPHKVRWGLCFGMVVLMIPPGILLGYLANQFLAALPHLSPWVSYPFYAIIGLCIGAVMLVDVLNSLLFVFGLLFWCYERVVGLRRLFFSQ